MTGPMDHQELQEQAALYALDVLTGADREVFEAHLASCVECSADLRSWAPIVGALAHVVPQVDPPAGLRARVLAQAHGSREETASERADKAAPRSRASVVAPWLAAAAMLVATIGVGFYTTRLRDRIDALD